MLCRAAALGLRRAAAPVSFVNRYPADAVNRGLGRRRGGPGPGLPSFTPASPSEAPAPGSRLGRATGCRPMRHCKPMTAERSQCPRCGCLLDRPAALCPIWDPREEIPEHIKREWAVAHWRGLILHLAKGGAVVQESATWEETGLLEADVRPLHARIEDEGEIERFAGYYRVRAASDASPQIEDERC